MTKSFRRHEHLVAAAALSLGAGITVGGCGTDGQDAPVSPDTTAAALTAGPPVR